VDREGPAAYVVRCACDPGADGSGGRTVVDHIRLFPLRDNVRWTYRVHEQILPALQRAEIPVRWTDLVVRHTGYTDPALRARKLDRDTRILLAELKERPDEPFVLFNLGAIAIERGDWHAALEYLGRSLVRSAPSDSITRKLFALIARAHQMLGDTGAALRACAEGLSFHPEDAELLFRQAVVTGIGGSRRRRRRAGGGSSVCSVRSSIAALMKGSTGTSPGGTWRSWRRSAATRARRCGSGARCWRNARAIARRWPTWGDSRHAREPAARRPGARPRLEPAIQSPGETSLSVTGCHPPVRPGPGRPIDQSAGASRARPLDQGQVAFEVPDLGPSIVRIAQATVVDRGDLGPVGLDRHGPIPRSRPVGAMARRARLDHELESVRIISSFVALLASTTMVATPVNEWDIPPFHSTVTAPLPALVICTTLDRGRLTVTVRTEPDWTAVPLVLRTDRGWPFRLAVTAPIGPSEPTATAVGLVRALVRVNLTWSCRARSASMKVVVTPVSK
jgi:hypothetical protein